MTLRLLRFFLQTNCLALSVELHHAVALRVADLISKNASSVLDGQSVPVKIEFPVENVVAQNERHTGGAEEFCTDQESLSDSFRLRLLGVFDANAKLRAVAQIIAQHRQIFGCGNDQHVPQTAEHQRGQWVTNHWFVVDRKKLFADDLREREK